MKTQFAVLLMLTVFFSQQVSAQHGYQERDRERGDRSMSSAVKRAPQIVPNAAPIIRTPENRSTFQPPAPQINRSVRNEERRQYHQANRHRDSDRGERGYHRHHRGSEGNRGTSVYVYPDVTYYPSFDYLAPFRGGYPTAPIVPYNNYYPNRYFVCYQTNQINAGLYRISCPLPVSWYSTSPEYSSYEYQVNYQPRFVCPNQGAGKYVEFDSGNDAIAWANGFCNQVVNQPDLP